MQDMHGLLREPHRHIFLIGPGGTGKSTVGPHLATLLARPFIDLDVQFIAGHGDIGEYIRAHGYNTYAVANAELFFRLIDEMQVPAVFALSSGLLATNEPVAQIDKSRALVAAHGVTVLLLPLQHRDTAMEIVVARQLLRGFGLVAAREREKFLARIDHYHALADIAVYSQEVPMSIAQLVANRLLETNQTVCKKYNQTI